MVLTLQVSIPRILYVATIQRLLQACPSMRKRSHVCNRLPLLSVTTTCSIILVGIHRDLSFHRPVSVFPPQSFFPVTGGTENSCSCVPRQTEILTLNTRMPHCDESNDYVRWRLIAEWTQNGSALGHSDPCRALLPSLVNYSSRNST